MSHERSSKFISDLRGSISGHHTLSDLWSWLLGDRIPQPKQRQVLVDHLNSLGWGVHTRDFIRGTAASNHPKLILLRMLRGKLSRSELDKLFFGKDRHN